MPARAIKGSSIEVKLDYIIQLLLNLGSSIIEQTWNFLTFTAPNTEASDMNFDTFSSPDAQAYSADLGTFTNPTQ